MANETVNVSLRLPPELAAYLDVVKQRTGKSRHQLIIDALTQQYSSDASTTNTSSPPATEGGSSSNDPILAILQSLSDRLDRLEDVKDTDHDKPLELAVSICVSHYIEMEIKQLDTTSVLSRIF